MSDPFPAVDGVKTPALLTPLPDQVPPDGLNPVRVTVPGVLQKVSLAPAETTVSAWIVIFLVELLVQLVVGSVYVYVNVTVPAPAVAGLKVPELLTPVPDQVPPAGL